MFKLKSEKNGILKEKLNISEGKIRSLEKEAKMLKSNTDKSNEAQKYTENLLTISKGRVSEIEAENIKLLRQREDLQEQIDNANKKTKQIQEHIENERIKADGSIAELHEEIDRAKERLRELARENEELRIDLKRTKEKERENSEVKRSYEGVREREKDLVIESEKLLSEIEKLQRAIERESKQTEKAKKEKDNVLEFTETLKGEINELRARENEARMINIKLQEGLNRYELTLNEVKTDYELKEKKIIETEMEVERLEKALKEGLRVQRDLQEELNQVATRGKSTENTKEELVKSITTKR